MKPVARSALIWRWATVLILIALVLLAGRFVGPPIYFFYSMHQYTRNKERQLLYELNHQAFAIELRRFADDRRWSQSHIHSSIDSYHISDPAVPEVLRAFNPSVIRVYDDRIEFECGSAFLSFGIAVFRDSLEGSGTKKLGEGIWFYSENGSVPPPRRGGIGQKSKHLMFLKNGNREIRSA
jgi:hypothetical protein